MYAEQDNFDGSCDFEYNSDCPDIESKYHETSSEDFSCNFENSTDDTITSEKVYLIVLDYCKESYYAASDDNASFKRGDLVIAKTRYGVDVVRIAGLVEKRPLPISAKELVCIKRLANENELATFAENKKKVLECNAIFKEKVVDNKLDMRLVTSHLLTPEPKIIFFFTADTRVDFRRLVKDLVGVFHLRVELRQITSRDESRIKGGIGQCGRAFCCSSFTDKVPNVSIKMARDQKFSLFSQKATGSCGKLVCCLSFEHNWYLCENKRFPPKGFRFTVSDRKFVVTDVNMVMGCVTVTDSQERTFKTPVESFRHENNTWLPDLNYFENLE